MMTVLRPVLFALLLVNLVYFAWSAWLSPRVDVVAEAGAAPDGPRIQLVDEANGKASDGKGAASPAAVVAKADAAGAPATASTTCLSIGPFGTAGESERATTEFETAGYLASGRNEEMRVSEGYWVSLPRQTNADAESRVLARLARAGITDASVMADTDGRRVSVGLFSERARADRRASAVSKLGFQPDVTERIRIGTTYWIDLELRTEAEVKEAEAFNEEQEGALELKPCPAKSNDSSGGASSSPGLVESNSSQALPG